VYPDKTDRSSGPSEKGG